jgi:hypothetical protein
LCGAVVRRVLSSDLSLGEALPLPFGVKVVLFTPLTQVKSSTTTANFGIIEISSSEGAAETVTTRPD